MSVNYQSSFKTIIATVGILTLGLTGCVQSRALDSQAQAQPTLAQAAPQSQSDVEALVKLGPRVAGTSTNEQASNYLVEQYRKAGYVTKIQPFTYTKFLDQGSTLTVNGQAIAGRALRGTVPGTAIARLVVVPNVGRAEDFAATNVKGAIALIRRGEIPFGEKAKNAAEAGAIAVVLVNNQPGSVSGTLNQEVKIPVMALSAEDGNNLVNASSTASATLSVKAGRQTVTGRNVIAHLPGVTQPKVVLGGHYDSVSGSPGANDNASGTAVVLDVARRVAQTPMARQTWFVAFDGEEDGLHGSRAFVKEAAPQFLRSLSGMLNFDMVGVNDRLQVGGSRSLTQLVQNPQIVTSELGNSQSSDHASFAAAGVPVLFFHRGIEPNYHKPSDRAVNPALLNQTTEAALTVLQQLMSK